MTTTRVTSREFNQDTGGAKRAAQAGPVYITDRGRPTFVLLTFDDYTQMTTPSTNLVELLTATPGVGDIDVDFPRVQDEPAAAEFD